MEPPAYLLYNGHAACPWALPAFLSWNTHRFLDPHSIIRTHTSKAKFLLGPILRQSHLFSKLGLVNLVAIESTMTTAQQMVTLDKDPFTPLVSQRTENKDEAVKSPGHNRPVAKNKPRAPSTRTSTEERKKKQIAVRERARRAPMKEVEILIFALIPELRGSADLIQKQKFDKWSG